MQLFCTGSRALLQALWAPNALLRTLALAMAALLDALRWPNFVAKEDSVQMGTETRQGIPRQRDWLNTLRIAQTMDVGDLSKPRAGVDKLLAAFEKELKTRRAQQVRELSAAGSSPHGILSRQTGEPWSPTSCVGGPGIGAWWTQVRR